MLFAFYWFRDCFLFLILSLKTNGPKIKLITSQLFHLPVLEPSLSHFFDALLNLISVLGIDV